LGTLYGNGKALGIVAKYNHMNPRNSFNLHVKFGLSKLLRDDNTFGVELLSLNSSCILEEALRITDICGTSIHRLTIHAFSHSTPIIEQLETISRLVDTSLIETYGISNFNPLEFSEWVDSCKAHSFELPSSLDAHFNLLEQRARFELLPILQDIGTELIPYRCLCRGLLAGRYTSLLIPPDSRASASWRVSRYITTSNIDLVNTLSDYLSLHHDMSILEYSLHWLLSFPPISRVCIGTSSKTQLGVICRALRSIKEVEQDIIKVLFDKTLVSSISREPSTYFET